MKAYFRLFANPNVGGRDSVLFTAAIASEDEKDGGGEWAGKEGEFVAPVNASVSAYRRFFKLH